MPPLPTQLRNRLETAVKQARRTAEAAAKVALERLTVGSAEPGTHLSVEERQLRNQLRAHGRQLGDQRDPKAGGQSISRLIHECAYEHWHRMLFARFLAENHLLIHDKEGMPVTLAECDELARDLSADDADDRRLEKEAETNLRKSAQSVDGWVLAARYAARMLPQIFRPDDPVLQVGFAPEHKRALERLVTELPVEVFTAEDSLGWVYQFWQAERKDEVNASGDKITGETLPAVTQLFTEHYMVLFLLHNTIGAWWAGKRLSADDADLHRLETEEEVRKAVSLPGYEFSYLRLIREEVSADDAGERTLEQQGKENLRSSAKSADKQYRWKPAAGAFPGWPKSLKDFKLLDPCCGSGHFLVAAFVLLVLMRMQDEKVSAKDACDAVLRENLHGLELDPRCTQIAAFALALTAWKFTDCFRPLPPLNIACSGLGVNARKEDWLALANGDERLRWGLARLYEQFQQAPELGSLINPRSAPGMGTIVSFSELYPLLEMALTREAKDETVHEIAVTACGLTKAADVLASEFTLVATNVPFLGGHKQCPELAQYLAEEYEDAGGNLANAFLMRLFEFVGDRMAVAVVTPQDWMLSGRYEDLRELVLPSFTGRALAFLGTRAFETIEGEVVTASLSVWENISFQEHGCTEVLALDAQAYRTPPEKAGALGAGSLIARKQSDWFRNPNSRITVESIAAATYLSKYGRPWQGIKTSDDDRFVRCFWEQATQEKEWQFLVRALGQKDFSGREHLILWEDGRGQLRKLSTSQSRDRKRDLQGMSAWGKVGVIINTTGRIVSGLYLGEAFASEVVVLTTQREFVLPLLAFTRSPQFAEGLKKLDKRVSVTTSTFSQVPFDLGHWQKVAEEKYPQGVPKPFSSDPTQWLFDGQHVGSDNPLQVAVARLLGYRWPRQTGSGFPDCPALGPDGLDKFVDEDGIVCIPSVRGEPPAAERLRALLTAAYSKAWSPAKLDELLSAVDYAGSNLEDWLRNGFFDQHSKLFHQRPFIWQIWDGRKDGFSALVNYHKLDHKLLEKLTYTYLGDWIKKKQEAVANEESGADDRLLKAQQLQDKLKLILEGEAPYDIFVRWKPLEQQPIGWHPDLNDGVRLNIRPFMEADVLRKRPNIKWGKDRGKNPPGSPWGEERDNDRHLTLAEKRAARGK
jgi:hypothetical protein